MRDLLKQICKNKPHSIQAEVAQSALEYDDPQSFFDDLLQHGCISGMVSSLIYYADTHAFYDKHYEEIEELRQSMKGQQVNHYRLIMILKTY